MADYLRKKGKTFSKTWVNEVGYDKSFVSDVYRHFPKK